MKCIQTILANSDGFLSFIDIFIVVLELLD